MYINKIQINNLSTDLKKKEKIVMNIIECKYVCTEITAALGATIYFRHILSKIRVP